MSVDTTSFTTRQYLPVSNGNTCAVDVDTTSSTTRQYLPVSNGNTCAVDVDTTSFNTRQYLPVSNGNTCAVHVDTTSFNTRQYLPVSNGNTCAVSGCSSRSCRQRCTGSPWSTGQSYSRWQRSWLCFLQTLRRCFLLGSATSSDLAGFFFCNLKSVFFDLAPPLQNKASSVVVNCTPDGRIHPCN